MKKLLVILMVVAMASFLFVGCLGDGVTPPVDDVDDDDVDDILTSATPVLTAVQESDGTSIFTVTSTSTLYMNEDELGDSILVKGTAPSESLVKIYIDDVAIAAAVGEASTSGLWEIAIAASSLGDDGEKVMTAKVTEVGLAESVASNAVTFNLDTVDPGIDSVAFTAVGSLAEATFTIVVTTTAAANLLTEVGPSETTAPVQTITAGTWYVQALRASTYADNIAITTPGGVTTTHDINSQAIVKDILIPGLILTFGDVSVNQDSVKIVISSVTAATTAIVGRATIKFDEDVDYTGMSAGTYSCNSVADDPSVYNETTNTGYFTNETTLTTAGTSYTITVYGVTDLAGNAGGTSAAPLTASATAGVASATSLKP